jgi:hypothetical protein
LIEINRLALWVPFESARSSILAQAEELIEGSSLWRSAQLAANLPKNPSHATRVSLFAKFECFVLEHHPENQFGAFLMRIKGVYEHGAPEGEARLEFVCPSAELFMAYALVLRGLQPPSWPCDTATTQPAAQQEKTAAVCVGAVAARAAELARLATAQRAADAAALDVAEDGDANMEDADASVDEADQGDEGEASDGLYRQKAGSIRGKKGAINMTIFELCGLKDVITTLELTVQLARWNAEDDQKSAPAFDMEKDGKVCYANLMACASWTAERKVTWWATFLVAVCVCARSSCLTTYCPKIEDTLLPEAHEWDEDGVPRWIELGFLNWKSRTKKNRNKRYGIRLHRNYLDSRFCPVFWLLLYLQYTGKTKGKLFDASISSYSHNITYMLRVFMLVPGSPHSIRRSGAQWAGRCGDLGIATRNAGRWKTFDNLMRYIGQGAHISAGAFKSCVDPIFSCWVFKPVTAAGLSTEDEM